MRHLFSCPRAVLAALAGLALTACSMVESFTADEPLTGTAGTVANPGCYSQLGAYRLPIGLLRMTVQLVADATNGPALDVTITPMVIGDRAQTLCLDYLASPTSKDVIAVNRDSGLLLNRVTSKAQDQTTLIAQNLINTGAELMIAGGRSTEEGALPTEKLSVEFNPFDTTELADVKRALRRFGLCLYVEDYSFDPAVTSPEAWCRAPVVPAYRNPRAELARLPVPVEAARSGILYRPNMAHKIVLYHKADPTGRNRWTMIRSLRFEMPNVSPIFSVGVDRAAFVERSTDLVFKSGVLANITIRKESEVIGFVKIPFALAKAVVDVPARILQVRIGDTNQEAYLLQTEIELIKAAAALNQAQTGTTAARSATNDDGTFVGACINANGTAADCNRAATLRE